LQGTASKIWAHDMFAASQKPWSRRFFLKWSLMTMAAVQFPLDVLANIPEFRSAERSLYLYNIHTGEHFREIYWADGEYLTESLDTANKFMRDYRTGDIKPIDIAVLNLIHTIQSTLDVKGPLQVISGYRSKKTNNLLIRKGRSVARNSYHLKGKAVDIYHPCVSLRQLRRIAIKLKGGGVGYYPRNHFVHVDTGPIRYW
jgi:uncharacterized protein YcbK (DUF882 family)